MTAWEYCKSKGTTLREVVRETGQDIQLFVRWNNNPKKKKLFDVVIKGVLNKGE